MAAGTRGKAEFFVETLSHSLQGTSGCEVDAALLKKGLEQAVSGLPKCKLKRELKDNFEEYFTLFLRKTKKEEEMTEEVDNSQSESPIPGIKRARNGRVEEQTEGDTEVSCEADTLGGVDLETALLNISRLEDNEQKCFKYQRLVRRSCFQSSASLGAVLDSWGDMLCSCVAAEEMRLFSEAVKNVTLVTGGVWGSEGVISDKKESSDFILHWTIFCGRVFRHLGDQLPSLSEEQAEELHRLMFNVLTVAKIRFSSTLKKDFVSCAVNDCLADILSMYISVSLSVDWREAGPLKHTRSTSHLATITDLFFGTSPHYTIDTLVQMNLSLFTTDRAKQGFIQLSRNALSKVLGVNGFKEYMKLVIVCSVAQEFCKDTNNQQDSRALQEAFIKVPEPSGFVEWLKDSSKRLTAKMSQPSTAQKPHSAVVVLEMLDKNIREELLQLCRIASNDDVGGEGRSSEAMFYVDTSGDKDCEVEGESDEEMEQTPSDTNVDS